MNYVISSQDLMKMLEQAAEYGASKALIAAEVNRKDLISQNKAFQEFGESFVRKMVCQKRITGDRRGDGSTSKIVFSRSKLNILYQLETAPATLKIK